MTRSPATETATDLAANLDGYVTDTLYPGNFHARFQVPWTQAVLRRHGVQPPTSGRAPFTFADLGCGDGYGLIVAAAAHPEGRFLGIDALPGHIARGRELASRLGLHNVELHCATFASALALPSVQADYVMAQGVLSWVSPAAQAALMTLAARWLRPGGVVSVGYNAMPAWAPMLPFQRLVRALSEHLSGNAVARLAAAVEQARGSGLIAADALAWFDERLRQEPLEYLPHEYLNAHWQPHWCSDVMRAMDTHGLACVADATSLGVRVDFALSAAQQATLSALDDPMARALAVDLMTSRRFRVDVFARAPIRALPAAIAEAALDGVCWATSTSIYDASLELRTPAGIRYIDAHQARHILDALQDGPEPLPDGALAASIDAMWMAGLLRPVAVAAAVPLATATNAALRAAANSHPPPMNALAGHHGGVPLARSAVAVGLNAPASRRLGIPFEQASGR